MSNQALGNFYNTVRVTMENKNMYKSCRQNRIVNVITWLQIFLQFMFPIMTFIPATVRANDNTTANTISSPFSIDRLNSNKNTAHFFRLVPFFSNFRLYAHIHHQASCILSLYDKKHFSCLNVHSSNGSISGHCLPTLVK
ncbi:hypothetical protein D3C81_1090730 [compost metagenome]